MTHIESVAVVAQATFGRDGAMFESLLGFVSQLSVVLWGLVILTVVLRFVGIRSYRHGAARKARRALVETLAPSAADPAAAVPTATAVIDLVQPDTGRLTGAGQVRLSMYGPTAAEKDAKLVHTELVNALTIDAGTNATIEQVLQPAEAPAAVATSVNVPRHEPRKWRTGHRSAAKVTALATNSTEA
ncbi:MULTISPECIES: hypothetical protein [unclassified Arthrobacter]|uniref:hypothetical protein n=1 Tax=unclassified Arthrobacter TaxID=235627 RepID=UPI003390A8B9